MAYMLAASEVAEWQVEVVEHFNRDFSWFLE